ncbi:glycosyltransferase [Oecophyllibacter saccharovorans]|uniref:glycosyltransferase family 4 protein n=1 Tax=Oecophyllibacter saccharovorans TaxID=2558360 RepID=UPI001143A111|nr:glycosyltransferase family 4 protein [Oecophyllibacter saccharovorans]QDH15152.1 glycosyltransferase [Oecophyllibacter saccharovorans]
MKIFYLMSSFEGGGASATLPDLLALIRERGHDVEVVACEARDMKIAVLVEKAGVPWSVLKGGTRGKPYKIFRLVAHLLRRRPDLIWTSHSKASFVGQVAGKILGIPVVSWKNQAASRPYSHRTRKVAKLWLADSDAVSAALQRDLQVPQERIMVWPLFECAGHPLAGNMPGGHTPGKRRKGEPLRVGTLGRLHPLKQYDLLLHALAALRQARPGLAEQLHVHIGGDGPQEEELKALARSLGVEDLVTFEGFVTDTNAFLDTLDVYIQPSLKEGLCLGVHEALSRGVPAIATPAGNMGAIVKTGETGILLESTEGQACIDGCCKALAFFLDHPEQCAPLGQEGRRRVLAQYGPGSFRRNGKKVMEHIEGLVRRKARPSVRPSDSSPDASAHS